MQINGVKLNTAQATAKSPNKKASPSAPQYEVAGTFTSDRWERTTLLHDRDEIFVQRQFGPRAKHTDPEVVKAFGTDSPHSGDALLHYVGPANPEKSKGKEPILLVHGANKDGNFFWDPKEDGSNKGLAQRLRDEGHEVYAITFAHKQDDNFLWAEQIANAVDFIKKEQGVDKIDLLAHSKGCQAARIYTENLQPGEGVQRTDYQDDVNASLYVAGPHLGVDYVFRHPSANLALLQNSDQHILNAPASWESMGMYPFARDVSDMGYSNEGSDPFPGQDQLLADLSSEYTLAVTEPDWATTYHGGQGFISYSKGIQHYIEQGGNVVERLNAAPPPESLKVGLLAGDRPNIKGILNEYTGPSDGLVFISSALGMPKGTNVVAQDVLPLNHKSLISDEKGQDWIANFFNDADTGKPQKIQVKPLDEILNKARNRFDAEGVKAQAESQLGELKALSRGTGDIPFQVAPTV